MIIPNTKLPACLSTKSKRRITTLKSSEGCYYTMFTSDELLVDFLSQFCMGKLYQTYGLVLDKIQTNPKIDYDEVFRVVAKYCDQDFFSINDFKILSDLPYIIHWNLHLELIEMIASFITKYMLNDNKVFYYIQIYFCYH